MSLSISQSGKSLKIERGVGFIDDFFPFNSLDRPSGRKIGDDYVLFFEFLNPAKSPIQFPLSEISNQPTWENTEAGLEIALSDINGWFGSDSGFTGLTNTELRATPVQVTVTNPTDLTSTNAILNGIKDFCESIESDTTAIDNILTQFFNEASNHYEVNNQNLLEIKILLQNLPDETFSFEAQLDQIVSNTGLGATETTLSAIKTAVELIDNVVESDRAKVNIIAGQAGVSSGNGLVDSGTIRTVDSAPVISNILSFSRTNDGTLITIPANKIWKGSVQVSGSILSAINAAAVSGHVRIDFTPGTGGTAAYRLAQVVLHTPAGALATTGTTSNGSVSVMNIEVYAGTTSATISLGSSNATQMFASCSGKIIN